MSAASADATDSKLSLQERQQVSIDRVGLRGRHAVREILVGFQRAVFQQFRRQRTGSDIGNDLVVFDITSTGIVIFFRSSVKSVCENATMPS